VNGWCLVGISKGELKPSTKPCNYIYVKSSFVIQRVHRRSPAHSRIFHWFYRDLCRSRTINAVTSYQAHAIIAVHQDCIAPQSQNYKTLQMATPSSRISPPSPRTANRKPSIWWHPAARRSVGFNPHETLRCVCWPSSVAVRLAGAPLDQHSI